jgi:LuxR family transcriptional regulator, maltose regulon positive regulatory protein
MESRLPSSDHPDPASGPHLTALRFDPQRHPREATPRAKFLLPRPGVWTLHRERLFALLDRTLDVPLTTVVAPAGYGKTTLVVDWLAARSGHAAWCSLDAQDLDLRTFMEDFLEALRPFSPGGVDEALSTLARGAVPDPWELVSLVGGVFEAVDDDVTVVIEDYHVANTEAVGNFLVALLAYPLPHLHLVLTSRSEIALPISLLRARGYLNEIGMDDLRFTSAEVSGFFEIVGVTDLDSALESELAELTEGWIAYLHLIALAYKREGVIREPARAGASISALEFLADEVLQTLDPSLREFLLHVAVPLKISPSLATALYPEIGDDASALSLLEQARTSGLFLTRLDSRQGWYQFHHLFRELLLASLERSRDAIEIRQLHQRAAQWFNERGLIRHGIVHLLEIGETDAATDLVIANTQEAIVEERWSELKDWMAALPLSAQNSSVELLLGRAWVAQIQGKYELIPLCIDRIQQAQVRHPTALLSEPALHAEIDLLRFFAPGTAMGPDDASTVAATAMDRLSGSDRYAELVAVMMVALTTGPNDPTGARRLVGQYIAESELRSDPFALHRVLWGRAAQVALSRHAGNVYHYLAAAEMLRRMAEAQGSRRLLGQGESLVGNALYELNRLDEAIAHYQAAIRIPTLGILFYLMATTMLARAYDASGRYDEASELLEQVHDRFMDGELTAMVPMIRHVMNSRSVPRSGSSARVLANSVPSTFTLWVSREVQPRYLHEFWTLVEDRPADWTAKALKELDIHQAHAESMHAPSYALAIQVLRSLVLWLDGQTRQAEIMLDDAMEAAESGGYVRTIADLGPHVQSMIGWYAALGKQGVQLDRIRAAFAGEATDTPAPDSTPKSVPPRFPDHAIIEDLSNREYDVLLGLQRRLSNKEIAEELSISHVTVKSHTRGLYSKLGVNSRRQAITRAVLLGIIPERE